MLNNNGDGTSELLRALQCHGLFEDINQEVGRLLASELELVELSAGQWLFRQGDPGDSMFVLESGRVEVVLLIESGDEMVVDKLERGAIIGEMALLSGLSRAAGVRATEDCTLIRFSSNSYERLYASYDQVRQQIVDLATPRFRSAQSASILRDYLGDLDAEALHDLEAKLQWRHVGAGELLFEQGDVGDSMVIVINGRLRIVSKYPNGDVKFSAEIGRGQTTGEFAILTGAKRTASVYAVRDSDLLVLSADVFEYVSGHYPKVGLQIARDVAKRIASGDQANTASGACSALSIALIPVSESVDHQAFSRYLAEQMTAFGQTLRFDLAEFDRCFGREGAAETDPDDPINIPILGWLTQQEDAHQFILYQADRAMTAWTSRCLRQADRLVFLVDPRDEAAIRPIEKQILRANPRARVELLFLHHDETVKPGRATAWLGPRQVERYHHVRPGSKADCRRFIRRLIGRPNGLVLSGGAARGFCHFGVYRALLEAGVEIDMIGGTSMGALVGALLAGGEPLEQVQAIAARYSSKSMLMDYTYPAVSMLASKKCSITMRALYGEDRGIEDLFMPFFCVSSNLTEMRPEIHTQGPLWEAIRASTSLPMVFSPVNYQGQLLVDGGLIDNMPVETMRGFCENGQIIAVDASPPNEQAEPWGFSDNISGWRVLGNRLNPFSKTTKIPSIGEVSFCSMMVNSCFRQNRAGVQADLLISPDTSGIDMLDWTVLDEMTERGYQSAVPVIKKWQETDG